MRVRSATFADHYSQARQFYISQTPVEQDHIVKAYTFELSKCEIPQVRSRMLAHLLNVHEDLATGVADGLGMPLPEPATPAMAPRTDLPPSDALSILKNGPDSFAGRKIGVLVTDGTDAAVLKAVRTAVDRRGRGAGDDRTRRRRGHPQRRLGAAGRPDDRRRSVGAVRRGGAAALCQGGGRAWRPAAPPRTSSATPSRTTSSSATPPPRQPLLEAAGVAALLDDGCIKLTKASRGQVREDGARALRYWERDVQP